MIVFHLGGLDFTDGLVDAGVERLSHNTHFGETSLFQGLLQLVVDHLDPGYNGGRVGGSF